MPICKFAFSVNSSPAFINWALLLNIDGQSFRVAVTDNCELVIDNQWDSEPKNTSSGLGMDLKIASPVRNPATPPLWTLNMPPDNGKMCSGICWYSWSTQWAECSGAGWGLVSCNPVTGTLPGQTQSVVSLAVASDCPPQEDNYPAIIAQHKRNDSSTQPVLGIFFRNSINH